MQDPPRIDAGGKPPAAETDTGLAALVTILAYYDIPADARHLAREFAAHGGPFVPYDIVAAARARGLKARLTRGTAKRITRLPMPAIARCRDGSFVILAKAGDSAVLVKEAGKPPAEWTHAELARRWAGDVILLTRRAALDREALRFGLSWFIPVMARYKGLFVEVLVASFFLQLFALVTPLFTQVVIDKVLVHRGLTTLDVLVIGLVALGIFEVVLGGCAPTSSPTPRAGSMRCWAPSCSRI